MRNARPFGLVPVVVRGVWQAGTERQLGRGVRLNLPNADGMVSARPVQCNTIIYNPATQQARALSPSFMLPH